MEIRPLTAAEQNYVYSQSSQISGQTGNIGHLRALDMVSIPHGLIPDRNGNQKNSRMSLMK